MARTKQTARKAPTVGHHLPVYLGVTPPTAEEEAPPIHAATQRREDDNEDDDDEADSRKRTGAKSSSSSESRHVANNAKRARGSGYGLFIQQSAVGAPLNRQLFPSAARGRLFEVVGYLKTHAPEMLHYVKLLFDYRMDQGKVTWSALRCLLQVDSAGQIRVLAIMKVRGGVPYWLNCIQPAAVPTEEGGVREDIPIEISPTLGYSFRIPSEGDVCYTKLINNIELGNATSANHWLYTSHGD